MHFGWLEAGEVVAATGRASGETMSDADSPADVWLVRHPETDWNRDGRYQGRSALCGASRAARGEPSAGPQDDEAHQRGLSLD